jgi:hypothetical protein
MFVYSLVSNTSLKTEKMSIWSILGWGRGWGKGVKKQICDAKIVEFFFHEKSELVKFKLEK